MTKVAHIIGNGRSCAMYEPAKGLKITCNLPPFEIRNVYTTTIVDFKMCKSMDEGSVTIPGDWVLGARPKKYCEMFPRFRMKFASQMKEFYTHLPKYAKDYTAFNCGHMATHYTANRLGCDEIHMYGFDTIFAFDITSTSDLILKSDRQTGNTQRLTNNWRPIWEGMFREFENTQFVLYYHKNVEPLISLPKNVEVRIKGKTK